MGGFPISRIAHDHAISVESMEVAFLSLVLKHRPARTLAFSCGARSAFKLKE
jgi:hypothetical protein